MLLTTGLQDDLPEIDGIDKLYGRTVHHCPYCDDHRDQALAVYGRGKKGADLAQTMKQWSGDVVLCTDGDIQTALGDVDVPAKRFEDRNDQLDVARSSSITPPEWAFN